MSGRYQRGVVPLHCLLLPRGHLVADHCQGLLRRPCLVGHGYHWLHHRCLLLKKPHPFIFHPLCQFFYPYEKCCDQCAEQHHLFAILNFAFYYLKHNFEKFRIHVVKFRFSRNFTYVIHGTMEGRGSRGAVGDGENSGCTLM